MMTVSAQDRPLDQLRKEVIDQLVLNYGHGKLSKDAFERRLDQAYDSEDHASLLSLAADLEQFANPDYDAYREHFLYADEKDAENSEWMVYVFSGAHREHEEIVPSTIRLVTIFGGCKIDYSMALFSSPVTHIKILSLFGGAHIYVPEGVKVKTRVIPLFSGTDNKCEPGNDPHTPLVIVSGLALFGGMHIGVRRTLRERMQNFADNIKQMLG